MKDKLISKTHFPFILGCSALFIALCAACFSVYGIATLFAGASVSVMVMASSLEIGKLVATTFLYRYWSKCQNFLKTYLVSSILILMLITSLGIFGYLSAAYQKSSIEFAVTQDKIVMIENQQTYYKDKIESSKSRIEALTKLRSAQESRMSEVLTNDVLSRNPIQLRQLQQQTVELIAQTDTDIKDENNKIQNSIDEIQKINDQVNQLKLGAADKKDVQTFKFVADALGVSLDTIARWFILSIIFVFDPLAICLVLAYNVAIYRKEDDSVFEQTKGLQKPDDEKPDDKPIKQLLLDSHSEKKEIEQIKHEEKQEMTTDTPCSQSFTGKTNPDESDPKPNDSFFNHYFKR